MGAKRNLERGFSAWIFDSDEPPARNLLRDQSSASSTTLTVPFGVHRECPIRDLRGSFVGNGAELLPLFGSQIIVSEELKTLSDEILRARELLEQKALAWLETDSRSERLSRQISHPIIRFLMTRLRCSLELLLLLRVETKRDDVC